MSLLGGLCHRTLKIHHAKEWFPRDFDIVLHMGIQGICDRQSQWCKVTG